MCKNKIQYFCLIRYNIDLFNLYNQSGKKLNLKKVIFLQKLSPRLLMSAPHSLFKTANACPP